MNVLVTGGAGFIGSNIIKLGLAEGWSITVLDNLSTGYRENLPDTPQLKLINGDIRDRAAVESALGGIDAVYHLAACVGNVRSIENPQQDAEVNVLGAINLLECMRRAGVKRAVYSSSAAIFGEPQRMPIDEGHPAEPDSPYGVSKLAAEKLFLSLGRIHKLQVTCLRYFNVYGVNQRFDAYGNVIPIFASRLQQKQPLKIYGDGEQTRDFVNVIDVARANLLALQHNATGVFNIGSGNATTINTLTAMMLKNAANASDVQRVDARPGEVRHSVADISAARKALNYTPTITLDEGLRQYMKWFASQGLHS
jgi:UDP-glucose 4-epimerase